jgi:hypothetical protein
MRLYKTIQVFFLFLLVGCSSDDPTRNNTFVPLTSIEVSGTYETMADQTINPYVAIGNFSGSFTRDITTEVIWGIEDGNIASVSNDNVWDGLVTALMPGETSVTATYDDISGSAPVRVTDADLTAIDISPQDVDLPIGFIQGYDAIGSFSDGTAQDITFLASWDSSDPEVATIDSTGLATTIASGNTTITGTWQDIAASSSLSVTEAVLTAITITPSRPSIALGTAIQFTAEGTYSDKSTSDVTDIVDWQSFPSNISYMYEGGLAEGVATGQAEISASLEVDNNTISDSVVLLVTNASLVSIMVTPENSRIQVDKSLQYTATGTFSDNTQQDITNTVTWISSNPAVGTISNSSISRGRFTSTGTGTTFIEAFYGGISDETPLTVE